MNSFQIPTVLVDRLGWVLLHSAWQFALIALLAGAIARAMRRNSAATRYGVLVVAMAFSVAAPIVTWLLMPGDGPAPLANRVEFASLNSRDAVDRGNGATEFASDAMLNRDGGMEFPSTVPVASSNASKAWPEVSPQATDIVPPQPSWSERARLIFRPWLGWIVVAWSLGVVMCSARPLLSWRTLRRLRSVGVSPVPNDVAAMLEQTAKRLRLRQGVQILQSTLTRVPVVIGYLRPVILLPISVIAGVPTAQLEAILAHELAHVRRHDFLVNLLQTLVETVFFYHPAVWWLSHRMRVERENCCDDLAVTVLGNRVEYGRALLAIEELRGTTTALALGARGGSLLDRVRRLFGRDPAEQSVGAGSVVGIVSVGLLALGIIALGVWNSTQADDEGATPGPNVVLEGDIQVKLLGVSYQPSENQPWWTPEGAALPGDPLANRGWGYSYTRNLDDGEHRELALEITGAERDVHAWVDFAPGEKLGVWSTFWNFQADEKTAKKVTLLRSVSAGFEKDQKQRDVLVRLAVAPWHPYQMLVLKRDQPQPVEKPEEKAEDGTVQLRRVHERTDGTTQVDVVFPANFELRAHHEVVAQDVDGNEVKLFGTTIADADARGDAGARGLIFRCPLNRLAMVSVRFRWYTHEITFRDVSLHPEHVTQVKAKVTQLEPPPVRSVATLPNGVTVELVGVSFHPSEGKTWWQANGALQTQRPQFNRISNQKEDQKQDEMREMAVKIRGIPKENAIHVCSDGGECAGIPSWNWQDEVMTGNFVVGPSSGDTASLTIGLSTEPMGPVLRIAADGRRGSTAIIPDNLRRFYENFQPLRVEKKDARLELIAKPTNALSRLANWQMVAVDKAGRSHNGTSEIEFDDRVAFGFDLRHEELHHFELRLRPYRYWVTFDNVSRHPGKKTDVNVKVAFEPIAVGVKVVDERTAATLESLRKAGWSFELPDTAQFDWIKDRLEIQAKDPDLVLPGEGEVAGRRVKADQMRMVVRLGEPPAVELHLKGKVLMFRLPFALRAERALFDVTTRSLKLDGNAFLFTDDIQIKADTIDLGPNRVRAKGGVQLTRGLAVGFVTNLTADQLDWDVKGKARQEQIDQQTRTILMAGPAEDQVATLAGLQGGWKLIELVVDGARVEAAGKDMKVIVKNDQLTYYYAGKDDTKRAEFRVVLDAAASPPAINAESLNGIGALKGLVYRGIYQLRGEELRICLPDKANITRPTKFESTAGSLLQLLVLRRVETPAEQSTDPTQPAPADEAAAKHPPIESRKAVAAVFVLRFVDAKLALAALKAEADIREIRGFEATADPRLNSILIIADADTLKTLQGILSRLDTPVGAPNPKSKLEGVWIAEKVTSSGEVVPKEKFPFELHFEKDTLIYRFVGPVSGKERVHEIVVDETKTPATIDITREVKGKKETVYGIYQFEGDRLLICSLRDSNRQPSKERPTTFDSSNEVRSDLLVLTRKVDPLPEAISQPSETRKTGRIEGRVFPFSKPEELPKLDEGLKTKLDSLSAEELKKLGIDPSLLETRVHSIDLYVGGSGQLFASAEIADNGTFAFENVPAGQVRVIPVFRHGSDEAVRVSRALSFPTTVRRGETTEFALFGKGRPVTGTITLPSGIKPEECHIALHYLPPPMRRVGNGNGSPKYADPASNVHTLLESQRRGTMLDAEGRFRIEGVREGNYSVVISQLADKPVPLKFESVLKPGYHPPVEYGKVAIPLMLGGESDKPHDLGLLKFTAAPR